MKIHQRIILATGISFLLFLISYKFSLYHTKSMLPYLANPLTLPVFTKILTFTMMMIGVAPTAVIILYNTILCHTALVNWEIQTICFGAPFNFSGNDGFFAYIIASLLCSILFGYFLFLFLPRQKHAHS